MLSAHENGAGIARLQQLIEHLSATLDHFIRINFEVAGGSAGKQRRKGVLNDVPNGPDFSLRTAALSDDEPASRSPAWQILSQRFAMGRPALPSGVQFVQPAAPVVS